MKTSLPRLTIALILVTMITSLTCMEVKAQSEAGQTIFHGGTYNSENERQALYASNSTRPLGGLFAPGFTRTMTFLGGANSPFDGVSENDFEPVPSPFTSLIGSIALPPRELDDSGYALSFAFGRRHSRLLRSEIEVAFRNNDITRVGLSSDSVEPDGSVSATSVMKNFIIDFENSSLFTPYMGAGLGLSYIDIEFGEATSSNGEATSQDGEAIFSFQAIGGIATKLNSFSDFVVEYRLLKTSQIEFGSLNDTFAYRTHTLFMGVTLEY